MEKIHRNRFAPQSNDGPVEVLVRTDVYMPGTHKLVFPQRTTISAETKRVNMFDQERLAAMFHWALVRLPDGGFSEVSFDGSGLDQAGGVALYDRVSHHYAQIFADLCRCSESAWSVQFRAVSEPAFDSRSVCL